MGGEDAVQVMHSAAVPTPDTRTSSMRSTGSSTSIRRKPVGAPVTVRHPTQPPTSPLPPTPPPKDASHVIVSAEEKRSSGQSAFSFERSSDSGSLLAMREAEEPRKQLEPEPIQLRDSGHSLPGHSLPVQQSIAVGQRNIENGLHNLRISHHADFDTVPHINEVTLHGGPGPTLGPDSRKSSPHSINGDDVSHEVVPQFQYFHQMSNSPSSKSPELADARHRMQSPSSDSQSSSDRGASSYTASRSELHPPHAIGQRPASSYAPGVDHGFRGRTHSPHLSVGGSTSPNGSPILHGRAVSASRRSPETRPISYVDLLNIPYSQQIAPTANLGNDLLRSSVGQNAFLLDHKKTLEMYRANVKKTQDNAVQYEFALFMVQVAREVMSRPAGMDTSALDPAELLREARSILQRLSDRGYPFAQYYLGDGYASGLFNKGKEDYDRAFPLFVAASKHGHAEAGYRAALCYEFGWGCRKDYAKAVQFYRASASRNHPGAATRLGKACLTGDMGLTDKYREGLKWLKRAAESADPQYNSGPYELGLLHETGYGPDLFKDETYAAQLFTQAAELGHPQASLRMGEAYEHGLLGCPKDPALSVHFYNGAAQAGLPEAMMNLCAWYMVGAEPVLDKDENEAYEWAKRAAELGYPKAEYAVGYFTEMGIGCRRDPLEANVWYVRAADQGDERAKQRLAIIRAAASGDAGIPVSNTNDRRLRKAKDDKECVIM